MHVALCHDQRIPPKTYGGTERVVVSLGKGLLALGHKVTLIARAGSALTGARILDYSAGWEQQLPSDIDIVQVWGTPQQPLARPFLVNIQGNGQQGERFHANTVFLSRKHAELHGSTHFIHNAVDPGDFDCLTERETHLVFLAKASWSVKNLAGAIEIARHLDRPLEVLGSRNWPLGLHQLLPRWRGVKLHGMVGDAEKRKVLSTAAGLLFPVRWHEPFGIATIEALASGCPVFGTPYGALPEIVSPEVGFLSADAAELANAITNSRFSPARCRQHVVDNFGHLRMAQRYLAAYQSILEHGSLDGLGRTSISPATLASATGLHSGQLLPWKGLRDT